jgi:hypothetical protein
MRAAVIADTTDTVLVDYRIVVNILNDGGVYVGDAGVIEIVAAAPVAAVKAGARITKAIVDASVEANASSPISSVPKIETVVEGPVSRSPKQAHSRRPDPHAWNPIVAVLSIGPITWDPDVTTFGTNRLLVNRQQGWTNTNGNGDVNASGVRSSDGGRCH